MVSQTGTGKVNCDVPQHALEPIAIVGIGCRLPGGVSNPSQFWDLLCEKRTGYQEFEPERINLDGYYHPNANRPASLPTRGANLLREDPRLFDHRFFGLKDVEVRTMDPNQRKMLEVTYEAFESAAEPLENLSGSRTGVFIGNFNTDHHLNQMYDIDFALPYTATGGSTSILSNRVNHVFNLRGPSVTIDTACSSSMYALHFAVNAIRNGDCDAAIVGGSNLILSPEMQLLTGSLGALSATSTCHTFDESADGYGRGEGFGALYLKRYQDAVDGDYPIRSVIRATAVNSNGKTAGISHPGVEGQESLIRHAYKSAQLSPRDTGYFECHGTGTPVGDPVEVTAIGKVFAPERESELLIGSVKTNLGHSESASGITGIIKCILAIENGVIPPTVGVKTLNPNIDFDGTRTRVVTEMTPWPENALKRASINSFGYGGANAHCILDHDKNVFSGKIANGLSGSKVPSPREGFSNGSARNLTEQNGETHVNGSGAASNDKNHVNGNATAADATPPLNGHSDRTAINGDGPINGSATENDLKNITSRTLESPTRHWYILPFSGHDEDALINRVLATRTALSKASPSDLSYTLSRRSNFLHKSFRLVSSRTPLETFDATESKVQKSLSSQSLKLGFVFTGQGAQWQDMGRALLAFKVFQRSIAAQDAVLSTLSIRPSWTIEGIFSGHFENSVQDAEISQTVCTALQIGLVDLLQSWHISAHAVVGHSSGEIAAAYAAGYTSRAEAIVIAYCRGKAIARNTAEGLMMAVGMSMEACEEVLADMQGSVKIAAVNSPSSITLSGDKVPMEQLYERLKGEGKFARLLHTSGNAYHSHHMIPIGEYYEKVLVQALDELNRISPDAVVSKSESKHWVSSVTPWKKMKSASATPQYWRQNLESPVQFAQAVELLVTGAATKVDVLIEIGPHAALNGPLKQILAELNPESLTTPPTYLPTIKRFEDGEKNLLQLCGELFCVGYPVNLIVANSTETLKNGQVEYKHGSVLTDLPTYQYNYGPVIIHETRIAREIRQRKFPRHDLLGVLQPGCARDSPSWRNILRLQDLPWLNDHKLIPHPVLPASGYVAMATEAIKQYFQATSKPEIRNEHCFRLRNVTYKSAMRIPEGDTGLETMLNLSRSSGGPEWYEFKISSVSDDGALWTDHASGLVSVSTSVATKLKPLDMGSNLRYIDTEPWYNRFTEAGLGYGPSFQHLWDISSDPYHNMAQAKIGLQSTRNYFTAGPESEYSIHPASLDLCHQLALISGHGGQVGRFKHAFIPIAVDEMTIWPAKQHDEWAQCVSTAQMKGLRGIHATIQLSSQAGDPRIEINNLRCVTHHGGERVASPPVHEYTRLVWKPDVSSLLDEQAKKLFPAPVPADATKEAFAGMDELAAFMILDLNARFGDYVSEEARLRRFLDWVRKMAAQDTPSICKARLSPISEWQGAIESLCDKFASTVDIEFAKRIYDNIGEILNGSTTGVEVTLQGNLLSRVYTDGLAVAGSYTQLARLLDLFGHRSPDLKILEIGAGTGAATQIALRVLAPDGFPKRYGSYTFSDVSSAFLHNAQSTFSAAKSMEFKVYDMTKAPEEQGFSEQFDLVIASECLHASPDLLQSLRYARKLLRPEGRMVLLETTSPLLGHNLAYGTFPDWWPEDVNRDSPFLSSKEWHEALRSTGFSGVDVELGDYDGPHQVVSTILTTAVAEPVDVPADAAEEKLYIVHQGELKSLHEAIAARVEKTELTPVFAVLGQDELPAGCRTILCLDTETWTLADASEAEFSQIKSIVRLADSILWLTAGNTLSGDLPKSAVNLGLVRMLTTEMPEARHAIFLLEAGNGTQSNPHVIDEIVNREARIHNGDLDRELAVKDDIVYIDRLAFDQSLNDRYRDMHEASEEPTSHAISENGPVVANFSKPGLISSLYFKPDEGALDPLPDDHIEIKTAAMGLNWKDLAVCTGRNDMNTFSQECSGKIIRCGSSVQDFREGDRVYALAWGKFGNTARLPASMAQRMRTNDRFDEMAGVPLVFCTAHCAFDRIARLKRGEKVLIQGATGGLGLAALQLARRIGAQIWCTVGTPEKAQFLSQEFGVEENRIFSSRDVGDLTRMLAATGGRGFDVILSSSNGSMMHETWRCIAPLGRFVDVGRLDVQNSATLAMDVFARNATYSSFDLSVMAAQDRDFCSRLMEEVGEMLRNKEIRAVSSLKTFDISELESALLYFSQGKHIGKVVVTYEDEESMVQMTPPKPSAKFDASALYILVGGLGGFGRGILQWMIAKGARNLAVWSRSGKAAPEAEALLSEYRHAGVNISIERCDITDMASVQSAVSIADKQAYPLKGVVHAAVTFCDQAFEMLSYDQWRLGLSAKVTGTENLHNATLGHDLDFFVMTSSYEAVVALPTQAAYCAANSFQDAFARHRRAMGLPATAVALGLITEIGDAGQRDITRLMIDRNNLYGTGELGSLRLLEAAFMDVPVLDKASDTFERDWAHSDYLAGAQITTCLEPVKLAEMLKKNGTTRGVPRWTVDLKFSHIMQAVNDLMTSDEAAPSGSSQNETSSGVDAALKTGSIDMARDLLVVATKERIAGLLRIPIEGIEAEKSVAAYGVDSLIAVELRSWFVTSFQSTVPLLRLLDESVSMNDLAGGIIKERQEKVLAL